MLTLDARTVTPDDAPFLAALHAAGRAAEVAAFGWDERTTGAFLAQQHAAREQAYAASYPDAEDRVLLVEGTPAGRALVHRTPGRVHLVDLAVLPAHQGRGLGTAVLRSLLDDAASAGSTVRLTVRADNTGARRLYERLGFVALDETGPDGTGLDVPMEARP
jgi:ribosomal protein S18 acetylase RimI-like enzyme